MDKAVKGAAALATSDFPAAVAHYTEAISSNSQAVDYYIKRSTAYTRLSPPDHVAAFKDAEIALVLATKRAKREFITQAQLRRGIALFGLQRWADAKQCFAWVKKRDEKEKTVNIWEMKVDGKLKALPEADPAREPAIKEIPDVEIPKEGAKKPESTAASAENGSQTGASSGAPEAAAEPKTEGVQTPASKIRHEWYQTHDTVVVTLFAKGVPKDKATIDVQKRSLTISFPLPTGSDFEFTLDPLFAEIDESASTAKIMSTKVEFSLKKVTPGQKWSSIEGTETVANGSRESKGDPEIKRAVLDNPSSGPSYPTSSKSGPKNWDKVASDLTKKPKKDQADGEGEGDDGLGDDFEGDPVNGFFQQLFKGADPDTRRAMMKSYQESNGTALSTNWAEVSKGKVETSPPDGMEAKKWGE
jgi:suppressor of G2 allele of SKP1